MTPKNFSFRYEWLELMDPLAEDEQMEIIQAIAHFGRCGEILELTYYPQQIFKKHIVPTLLRRRKAAEYRARAKARREAEAAKKEAEATDNEAEATENAETEAPAKRKPTAKRAQKVAAPVAVAPTQTDIPADGSGKDPVDPGAPYSTVASQSKITR